MLKFLVPTLIPFPNSSAQTAQAVIRPEFIRHPEYFLFIEMQVHPSPF
jgi:hypothetical protein